MRDTDTVDVLNDNQGCKKRDTGSETYGKGIANLIGDVPGFVFILKSSKYRCLLEKVVTY